MKASKFPQYTKTLGRPSNMTDEECSSLDIHTDNEVCVSLWRMSIRERFSALFFGKTWCFVYSGDTQPPVSLLTQKNIFDDKEKKDGQD